MTRTLAKFTVVSVVALATVHTGASVAAHDVRIGTRTQLDVTVSAEGTLIRVDGNLRDNVGQGVSGEIVTVEFERSENPSGISSGDARSDRTGRFYRVQRLGTGVFRGVVKYTGREHYYAASRFEFKVESKQGTVVLDLTAPPFATADAPVEVQVLATSGGRPVAGIPLAVALDGEASTGVETGEGGVARVTLEPRRSGDAQPAIWARFSGNMDYASAAARSQVRVLDEPLWRELDADQVRQRLRRGVQVHGLFEDRSGPIAGVPIHVVFSKDGAAVGRFATQTDAMGAVEIFVSESDLEHGANQVVAVARVGSERIAAGPVSVLVTKTGSGVLVQALGGVFLVCVLVLFGVAMREIFGDLRRRHPRAKPSAPKVSLAAARSPTVMALTESSPPTESSPGNMDCIAGVVSDAQNREAISGARVVVYDRDGEVTAEMSADSGGVFHFEKLSSGRYEIQARSKGYVTAVHRFSIPHGGELAWFRFPLTPVRVVVRDLYEGLVEDVGTMRNPWGKLTPRQTVAMLLSAVRAPGGPSKDDLPEGYQAFRERLAAVLEARRTGRALRGDDLVSAIVEVLEEVYYSQRLHDEAVATIMERLTTDVRARAGGLT